MPAWTAFGTVVAVVLALLLALSWLTQRAMSDGADVGDDDDTGTATAETVGRPSAVGERAVDRSDGGEDDPAGDGPTDRPPERAGDAVAPAPAAREAEPFVEEPGGRTSHPATRSTGRRERLEGAPGVPAGSPAAETLTADGDLSGGALLANVAASQGTFTVVLVVAAVATGIPAGALGLSWEAIAVGPLAAGLLVGVGLAIANQGAVRLFRRLDVAFSEELRELLAPETGAEWAALTLGVLPLVAVFEEFLFRAILIGAFAAGFGVDPWLLVVVSSALFAAGHSAQGVAGMVVTGGLGLVLGAAFVLTGSLATVVLAHYLVNLLEFLIHER